MDAELDKNTVPQVGHVMSDCEPLLHSISPLQQKHLYTALKSLMASTSLSTEKIKLCFQPGCLPPAGTFISFPTFVIVDSKAVVNIIYCY